MVEAPRQRDSIPPPDSGEGVGPTVLVVDDALIDRMTAGDIVERTLGGRVVYATRSR